MAAVGLLRSLGAVVTVDGDVVRAEIPLDRSDPAPRWDDRNPGAAGVLGFFLWAILGSNQ